MKTSNPFIATLLFISFAAGAAPIEPESIAQAAGMVTAGIAYGVALGALAYGLAALGAGLALAIAFAIAGIADFAKR